MEKDLWKYGFIVAAGALLGWVLGNAIAGMLIVAIGIVVWQTHRINLILKWLDKPSEHPMPEMGGLYYELHKKLAKRNAKYSRRTKQISGYLTEFRKAVSALPDAIVLIDRTGKIEWANSNADTLLGIRWPEDAGVRFRDLVRHPEVERVLLEQDAYTKSYEISSLTHQDSIINLKSVPYSRATRMLVARDVSQLVQVNQMQADFVANVSHELKTPLTVLKGYVEILQSSKDMPAKIAKPLEQMAIQTTRMQFIVNDLLYLAKLEDKTNRREHAPVEVSHLVNAILESVQPLMEEKRHKIVLDIDHTIQIIGAENELHSAFSNLITNAINYTPAHGEIKVTWQQSKARDDSATFSVSDNGLGIPAHHLSRLTQRFYRIDTDRSRESGGTGLGLAIVKHVLQRHNGELDIQSTEGVGSTFACVFPLGQIVVKQGLLQEA